MKVLFVTSNPNKLKEAQAILRGTDLELLWRPTFLGSEETGHSFTYNALAKAQAASRLSCGMAVMAEDAGLEVDCLGGAPGVYSARFAGAGATDDENNRKLIAEVLNLPTPRLARYRAYVVLLDERGRKFVGEGAWEGEIITEPRGSNGFGYDPLFVPHGEAHTAAEMPPPEKDAVSHRKQALNALSTLMLDKHRNT